MSVRFFDENNRVQRYPLVIFSCVSGSGYYLSLSIVSFLYTVGV